MVEHFPCLGKALKSYYRGDTIVVYPGKYTLEGRAYQLADSVHITGIGNPSEIIGKLSHCGRKEFIHTQVHTGCQLIFNNYSPKRSEYC